MARGLTDKQKAWIDYYKSGHSATESAKLAGYNAKSEEAFSQIGSENYKKLGKHIEDRDAILEKPRIADMQEIYELISIERDIMRVISSSPLEETDKHIMEQRYLNYMKWEEIAVGLHYAYRWVMRRHKRAIVF